MSKKSDFEGIEGGLVIAFFYFYETLFAFSRKLGIPWFSINIPVRGRLSPSVSYGIFTLSILSSCLVVFLFVAIRRTYKRIKRGEVTVKKAICEYIWLFIKIFLWWMGIAIIVPPILRFIYYIF